MKAFKDRIKKLLEQTSNNDIREQANIILQMIEQGANQKTLYKILIENINKIDDNQLTDLDKKFIENEKRINLIENLELNTIFETLQNNNEDLKAANPQLVYIISQLRTLYETSSNPEVFIAESLMNVLSKFKFVPIIEQQHNKLSKIFEENEEDIIIIKTVKNLNAINKGFYSDIISTLESYLYNKGSVSKSLIIEKLKKYEYEFVVKQFINEFYKFCKHDSFNLVNENSNFKIENVYSFVKIDESNKNKVIFNCYGNYYEKYNNKLTKLNESQIELLPDNFKKLNNFLYKDNIRINESGIDIFIGKNKVSIREDNEKQMFLNENLITVANPYQYLMQTGLFKYSEAEQLEEINSVYENFNLFVNIDFAKAIKSSIFEGLGSILFKLNDNNEDERFYIHTINEGMRINEFKENANPVQIKNKLLEFMNYDISESLSGFIDKTNNQILDLKTKQVTINEEILKLNNQLTKIEQAELDPLYSDELKKLNLKEAINQEIENLKLEWQLYETKINKLQKIENNDKLLEKNEDSKFKVNAKIKIKNTNTIGKITSINTVTKELTILTDEGDTMQCSFESVDLIEDTIAKNADDLQAKAKEVNDLMKSNESKLDESVVPDKLLGFPLKKNFVNETITPRGEDDFTSYGVKDDKKAKGNERSEMKSTKDPSQDFTQEDKKVLTDIDSKITKSIQALGELENFLEQYTKVNKKPITSVLNQLKSYHESILNEISKI